MYKGKSTCWYHLKRWLAPAISPASLKSYFLFDFQWIFQNMVIFISISIDFGITKDYTLNRYTFRNRTIKFLTADEFNRLYHCRFPSEHQAWQRARDLFSFMVSTGLRVSDLKQLNRQNVTNGCITLVAEKTDKATTIPLNDISKAIIKKYEDFHFRDDLLLPIMSEQKINKYLKEAAEWAEITDTFSTSYKCGGQRIDEEYRKCDKISCHWARRTFVSLCLASGATMTEVRAITGHSSESAIKPYVGITMEERERATSMLDAVVKPGERQA